ncbi:PPC domain-containing DNA-binding protein [Dactylosporangium sp. NPDC051485]|uniref:PPC domain-containing DNA-binding protein n=1 Tax=Dactylosporangium sp. NPDC051485 TaxID=3154846 RepID=UPI00343E580E
MFVAEVRSGEEVIESITRQVAARNITAASLTVIGAIKGCTISVMPKGDETDDILTDYDEPFEITGTGEVVNGAVHVHVSAGGEGRTVVGHLHRATVSHWFVRAYVTPIV